MLLIKALLGILLQLILLAIPLLLLTDTFYWIDALIWLSIYAIIASAGTVYLFKYNIESLEARMKMGIAKQPLKDKLATAILILSLILGLALCPLDKFYWQISSSPPFSLKVIGLIVYVLGFILVLVTIATNKFGTPTIHVQKDRGHKVIDSGLYAYVRHPMYTGFMFVMLGTFFWLGTYLAIVLGILMILLSLSFRIVVEEAILLKELNGYKSYCKKVKARIIPFLI